MAETMTEVFTRKLQALLLQGQNDSVIKEVERLLDASNGSHDRTAQLLIFKAIALMRMGMFKEARDSIQKVLTIGQVLHDPAIIVESHLVLAETSWQQGKLAEAITILRDCECELASTREKITESRFQRIEGKLLFHRAVIFQKKGDAKESLQIFEKARELLEKSNDWHYLARCLNGMGLVYWKVGQLDEAKNCFEQALHYSEQIDDHYSLAHAHNNLAIFNRYKGDLKTALDHLVMSKKTWEMMGNQHGVATSLINMGVILELQGELDKALQCYEESYILFEKSGDEINSLQALQNLSGIREKLGHFNEYRSILAKIARIQEKKGLKSELITTYINLGRAFLINGELTKMQSVLDRCQELLTSVGDDLQHLHYLRLKAEMEWAKKHHEQAKIHLEQSLQRARELGNPQEIMNSLYELFMLHHELQDKEEMKAILDQMHELIRDYPEDDIIRLTFTLSRAFLLMTEPRFIDRIKSLAYIDEVLQEEGEFLTGLKIAAWLAKMRILLDYIQLTNDERSFAEVHDIMARLLQVSKTNALHPLYIELLLIKARLELIKGNLSEPRRILTIAEQLAEERGLLSLAMRSSMEHDKILDLISKWKQRGLPSRGSLIELIQQSQLEDYLINSLYPRPTLVQEFPNEIPVLFAIYDENGIPLYTRAFTDSSQLQEYLVGSFMTALATFARQVFNQALERAKMGQYNILIKSLDTLRVFYVFQGLTYPAQQKLENFIERMMSDLEILDKLRESRRISQPVDESAKAVLDRWINEIILSVH